MRFSPPQKLLVLMATLAKKLGGTRTVAVIASSYRLLMKVVSPRVREWDSSVADELDSAVACRRVDDAAARRLLEAELAQYAGDTIILILWDLVKFFDRIDPVFLTDALLSLGFPAPILSLAMLMHRAPRRLVLD